jgi:phospholipase/lecithinase/hemolysin
MKVRKTAVLVTVAVLAVVTTTVPTAARARFARIVAFGTSLSDSGNAFALRGGTNTAPDYDVDPFLIPTAPYSRGGHHFSNGATWVEQLARPAASPGRSALDSSD